MKCNKIYIVIFSLVLLLSGCGNKQQNTYVKKDKAPDTLIKVSDNIKEILKNVEEVEALLNDSDYEILKLEAKKEAEKKEDQDKTIIEMEESKKQEEKKSSEKQNLTAKKEISGKEEKQINIWESIDKKIEETHEKWNKYQPEGNKKSINANIINQFKTNLNLFTKAIEDKNIYYIYDYGSKSLLDISSVYNLYKDEISGPINKLRYKTYQAYLLSKNNKKKSAILILDEITEETNKIRLIIEKDESKMKLVDQLNFVLEDYKTGINENSLKLDIINKNIILNLLDDISK